MTTLLVDWPEPDTCEDVARRLRMYMGDKKLTRKALAEMTGIPRSTLSNKLDAVTEFTIGEVMQIAKAIDKSWIWVLTGRHTFVPPDGEESRLGESNPRPIHYEKGHNTPESHLYNGDSELILRPTG